MASCFPLNYPESSLKDIGDFQLPRPAAKWLPEGGRCCRMWAMLQTGFERPSSSQSHEQSAHRAVVSRGPCATLCFHLCISRNSVYKEVPRDERVETEVGQDEALGTTFDSLFVRSRMEQWERLQGGDSESNIWKRFPQPV